MALEAEATYENGVLKLDRLLPLAPNERVVVSIRPRESHARKSSGLIPFTGDRETIERIALDPEFSVEECP
jgi:predicted DNA-binding antitoxin AbrB/MazE fold protein